MKKTSWLIASLIIFLGFVDGVKAETTLELINRTGVVKFAMRNDSPPFGYLDNDNNLRGLCLDFFYLLKQKIREKLNRQTITVKVFQSSLDDRFSLVENKQVHLECGPNTIHNKTSEKVAFSREFFITGIQFLVGPGKVTSFNPEGTLENFVIGVLKASSTAEYIRQRYPLAEIQEYQGQAGRFRGIQALRQDKIDAFVSDGVLLIGETVRQGSNLFQNYTLLPEAPLVCERYGIIVANDPEWIALVNGTITEMIELRQIPKNWFDIIETYQQKVKASCEQ